MPSVLGLLEQRELVARERVEALREEVDRVLARQRVGQVMSAPQAVEAVSEAGQGGVGRVIRAYKFLMRPTVGRQGRAR
ncbi:MULTISPECIES: hypothetical protein [unclassified Streptomyces]|uniref:hypothetical protein n=1 Tax=unclassified Streptomyces TaxID=2593676 RepID=UPI002E11F5B6|nr:hypothetical protein OG395_49715 [Streptomyces sp. NBC_01320]